MYNQQKRHGFCIHGVFLSGASVLIGLFKKRCHTNGFSDFRVADFLVFTLQAVTEMPKSKPTS